MATVLVVDDEADIRELVRINLVMAGHNVVLAADGVEGLDAVEIEQPDLVILDVMMPELDGWEVLARMKASPEEHVSNTPVVMLTARSDDMDRIRGGIEGAIYYLTKPFSLADLRERVEEVLGGGPEPDQRRRAQQQALEDLARLEKGAPPAPADEARIRMTRLERVHEPTRAAPEAPPVAETKLTTLSEKQRELLEMVSTTPTVSEAAERLEVSRSNVYASLRRIARKLEVRSVSELVQLARTGRLFPKS
jgi:DNA-binding response OmpR family regulator